MPLEIALITHRHLRAAGDDSREGVVLWIGTFDPPSVTRAVVPEQQSTIGRFHVPLAARQQLARELAGTGQVVVAQVHSHPRAAFHSLVDDEEAIPRRRGAYSLVVPTFGSRGHLLEDAALFQLGADGRWLPAPLTTFAIPPTVGPAGAEASPNRSLWQRLIDTVKRFGPSRT